MHLTFPTLSTPPLLPRSAIVAQSPGPRALLYFSHDHHLLQLQTQLGLHRPLQHLQHDNRLHHDLQPFNVSSAACFSTNLAFVLYRSVLGQVRGSAGQHAQSCELLKTSVVFK